MKLWGGQPFTNCARSLCGRVWYCSKRVERALGSKIPVAPGLTGFWRVDCRIVVLHDYCTELAARPHSQDHTNGESSPKIKAGAYRTEPSVNLIPPLILGAFNIWRVQYLARRMYTVRFARSQHKRWVLTTSCWKMGAVCPCVISVWTVHYNPPSHPSVTLQQSLKQWICNATRLACYFFVLLHPPLQGCISYQYDYECVF